LNYVYIIHYLLNLSTPWLKRSDRDFTHCRFYLLTSPLVDLENGRAERSLDRPNMVTVLLVESSGRLTEALGDFPMEIIWQAPAGQDFELERSASHCCPVARFDRHVSVLAEIRRIHERRCQHGLESPILPLHTCIPNFDRYHFLLLFLPLTAVHLWQA